MEDNHSSLFFSPLLPSILLSLQTSKHSINFSALINLWFLIWCLQQTLTEACVCTYADQFFALPTITSYPSYFTYLDCKTFIVRQSSYNYNLSVCHAMHLLLSEGLVIILLLLNWVIIKLAYSSSLNLKVVDGTTLCGHWVMIK